MAKQNDYLAVIHRDQLPFYDIMSAEDKAAFFDAQVNRALGREMPIMSLLTQAVLNAHDEREARFEQIREKKKLAGEQSQRIRQSKKSSNLLQQNSDLLQHNEGSVATVLEQCLNSAEGMLQPHNHIPITNSHIPDTKETEECALVPKRSKRFAPPTVEQVKTYCNERNNGIDPETFVDFYASKGWKVGKETMKDWKASVRTWEKRNNAPVRAQDEKPKTRRKFVQTGITEDGLPDGHFIDEVVNA